MGINNFRSCRRSTRDYCRNKTSKVRSSIFSDMEMQPTDDEV